jgi:hypothetical protein
MVILNAQGADTAESPLVILTSQPQEAHIPNGFGKERVFCSSPERLAELLGTGFENWQSYRDLVIERSSNTD